MASCLALEARVSSCSLRAGRASRRCVVVASASEGSRSTEAPSVPPSALSSSTIPESPLRSWRLNTEPNVAASGVLRANRGLKLLRNESRRLGQRRLAAFLTAVALTALAWYGQDLLTQLGRITSLPLEEVQGIIYFIICFNAVSLVLPKSRRD